MNKKFMINNFQKTIHIALNIINNPLSQSQILSLKYVS